MDNQENAGINKANESILKMYKEDLADLAKKVRAHRNKIEQIKEENISLTKDRLQLEGQAQLKLAKIRSNEYESEQLVNAVNRFNQEIEEIKKEL